MPKQYSRQEFLETTSLAAAGITLGTTALTSKSYGRIIGANDRINFAVAGVRSRGGSHISAIASCENAAVTHICDVDTRYAEKASLQVEELFGHVPASEKDIRKLLEVKDIDAITIATPEHWHAPMAIMALKAGKHVYVEKPPSHNPAEGELLVEAQQKYGKLVQMGNQQRSAAHMPEIMGKIREGVIGRAYFGKAWYSNDRDSIGIGKKVPVPEYLDWELWQGPAPRRPYKDNVHPYNWHWFWHWGTGETLNNGTHEVDLCLWALDVKLPLRVSASGGRYHFKDDWEFYDTLVTSFEYEDKMITWEGKSCNRKSYYGRGRGVTIHGTEGTLLMDGNGYEIYDNNDEKIFEYAKEVTDDTLDVRGGGQTTDRHFQNFIDAIRKGDRLNSPIAEGNISITMLQLSNIAWKVGRVLHLDPTNGHILKDRKAMKMWDREYEPGWELEV
ncbi:MAG: Gfo/Idh/MocA family oxidoreductase [Fidelibacterota bacterium]|nr:MAG: Gfo/Idh/MocA family oxidoreductase [Candidatus Neomarinimicrobiota bacterium]